MPDSILVKVEECLDEFFPLIHKYFEEHGLNLPDALTIHMLNHYTESIRQFGTPVKTSTETKIELPHKAGAKKPAKRASNREMLEFGAFRQVVARDAMTRHFIFLATYHTRLVCHRSWGLELDTHVAKIDSIRHLDLPGVPRDMASFKSPGAAERTQRLIGEWARLGQLASGLTTTEM